VCGADTAWLLICVLQAMLSVQACWCQPLVLLLPGHAPRHICVFECEVCRCEDTYCCPHAATLNPFSLPGLVKPRAVSHLIPAWGR
jgi:hypothetical protein